MDNIRVYFLVTSIPKYLIIYYCMKITTPNTNMLTIIINSQK